MKRKLLISATNSNLEHYALDMFKSFRQIDKDTPTICICDHISRSVEVELGDLGVKMVPYRQNPEGIRNVSVMVSEYVPTDIDEVMWMDIDALFLKPIPEVWDREEDIVCLPGIKKHGQDWIYQSDDGSKYLALGMWKLSRGMLNDITGMFRMYLTVNQHPDEGRFIRHLAALQHEGKFAWQGGDLSLFQLDGPTYYCGREMVELLEYNDRRLSYRINGNSFYPKCLQFNIKYNNTRPISKAVDQWK